MYIRKSSAGLGIIGLRIAKMSQLRILILNEKNERNFALCSFASDVNVDPLLDLRPKEKLQTNLLSI
jgi:hypothetical protein